MRRRNLLGSSIEYIFSAQTTSTSVTACITSVTINLTSTVNGQNAPYTVTTYSGKVTGYTTGDTSITIKTTTNTGTSQQSGSITLKQTNSNKTITIYVYQYAGTGYTFTTSDSTSQNVDATSGYVYFYYTSRNSCSSVVPSYTKSGAMIESVTCYAGYCIIRYSRNTDTASTRSGTVTLTQGGSGNQITITFTQGADYVTSTDYYVNVKSNFTFNTVTSIKPVGATRTVPGNTTNSWAYDEYAYFDIFGDGNYQDGDYYSVTSTTYYKSGNSTSTTQRTNLSGHSSNGFYRFNTGKNTQNVSEGTFTVNPSNITCTLSITKRTRYGCLEYPTTLTYSSIVSPSAYMDECGW